MTRNILTLVGFLLFMLAAVSILISLVGLQVSFMQWMDAVAGRSVGFLLKILMLLAGVIIAFFSKYNFAKDDDEYTLEGRG